MPHDFSIGDWLKNGWILELEGDSGASAPADDSKLVIGGGPAAFIQPHEIAGSDGAVWIPDFFQAPRSLSGAQSGTESEPQLSTKPWRSSWTLKIEREALIEKILIHLGTSVRPMGKVVWESPSFDDFKAVFERLKKAFCEEGVKKAVPVVFARGLASTSNREAWLAERLLSGLQATRDSRIRLYGSWAKDHGFFGATPELLFSLQNKSLVSMAVAGTRSIGDDIAHDHNGIENLKRDLEADPKDRSEHEFVVSDIESILKKHSSSVMKSRTRAERFGRLLHLVTDLDGKFSEEDGGGLGEHVEAMIEALHPTPALGVSPRDSSLKLLRELESLSQNHIGRVSGSARGRGNFGAPFIVGFEKTVHAVVAIRQIRWRHHGSDQIELSLGSGCGVLPESDVEKEWAELKAKRAAVAHIFRLTPEAPRPVLWSLSAIHQLIDFGVRTFIVCAGARNAPLVVALDAILKKQTSNTVKMESFFEERAAAFYALGLARGSGEPVAVVTTSGTAAAELLPAIAEADSSGVPLIAVTADRPHRLRGSGAPQSIPQQNLFADFVERRWDLEVGEAFEGFAGLSRLRPLHLNLAYEEPLLRDAEHEPLRIEKSVKAILAGDLSKGPSLHRSARPPVVSSVDLTASFSAMSEWLLPAASSNAGGNVAGRVAIVAGLHDSEREVVAKFLLAHQIPSLLEATSGLRGDPRLRKIEITGGEIDLIQWCASHQIQSVLRIGGVPTTRVWRDLDEPNVSIETLSISRLRFKGMSRGGLIQLPTLKDWTTFFERCTSASAPSVSEPTRSDLQEGFAATWSSQDQHSSQKLEAALENCPNSEPDFVRKLSELIPDGDLVYIGNSLPIRWWDLVATRNKVVPVEANRGVNGIDGQISTALGLSQGRDRVRCVWILVGDLTALYDLSAPWALIKSVRPDLKVKILILNNSGGRIFSRVLAKAPSGAAPFENAHDLDFESWAKMWNLRYERIHESRELASILSKNPASEPDHCVIELIPEAQSTVRFWTEFS